MRKKTDFMQLSGGGHDGLEKLSHGNRFSALFAAKLATSYFRF
jgi:hypothetical protein